MKKYKNVLILLFVVITLTAVISWICFSKFSNKTPNLVNSLEIYLQNSKKLEKGNTNNKSSFEIVNRSDVAIKYNVVISDNSNDNDGIGRKYLDYIVSLDNKKVKSDKLINIKNNVIYTGTIDAESRDKYSLEIYLDEDEDLEGMTYDYKLTIVPIMQ